MESNNDELTFLDMKLSDVYLAHHGVKGMKWGVWNAATRAKYLGSRIASAGAKSASVLGAAIGSVGRKAGNSASALGERIKARIGTAKANSAQRKEEKNLAKAEAKAFKQQQKEERKQHRKEIKMDPVHYEMLRRKTLKSHDPEVIAEGMHTLTDAELDLKLNRLERESKINKLAYAKAEQREKIIQAKFKTITDNPVYKIGEGAAKTAVGTLLNDSLVDKGIKPVLDQRVSYAANRSQNKFFDKHAGATRSAEAETARKEETAAAARSFAAKYENTLSKAKAVSDAKAASNANKYINELRDARRDSSGHISTASDPAQAYIDELKNYRRNPNGSISKHI